MWSVTSRDYARWHQETWGNKPPNDALVGCADWNIDGWSRSAEDHFTLTNSSSDENTIDELLENVETRGIPFLDRMSSWERAAEQFLSEQSMFDRAADFYLIADNRVAAREALLEGIRTFEVEGRPDNGGELPVLKQRIEQLFPTSAPTTDTQIGIGERLAAPPSHTT